MRVYAWNARHFFSNFEQIPYVFGSIFHSAFSFESIGGGVGGAIVKQAVDMGFKRGVFSNEAGLGSSVMVNSSSDVKEPVVQGMWGILKCFRHHSRLHPDGLRPAFKYDGQRRAD